MGVTFDPAKNAANITKHGISLDRVADMTPVAVVEDDRYHYGETRQRVFGFIDDVAYCAVITERGDDIRVISLRRARAKEMKRYAP
jgi:uncharacterized DUF497 family protein